MLEGAQRVQRSRTGHEAGLAAPVLGGLREAGCRCSSAGGKPRGELPWERGDGSVPAGSELCDSRAVKHWPAPGRSGSCRAGTGRAPASVGAVFSGSVSDLTLLSFKAPSCASSLGQRCLLHSAGFAPG